MPTPINALKDAVAALIASTTPPDRFGVRYRRVTTRIAPDGTLADRSFWFDQSERVGVESEAVGGAGQSVSYTRWRVGARVLLCANGRGVDAFEDAVNTETNLLARRVELNSGWPAGVLEVLSVGASPDFEGTEDVTIGISMVVLTAETDGN